MPWSAIIPLRSGVIIHTYSSLRVARWKGSIIDGYEDATSRKQLSSHTNGGSADHPEGVYCTMGEIPSALEMKHGCALTRIDPSSFRSKRRLFGEERTTIDEALAGDGNSNSFWVHRMWHMRAASCRRSSTSDTPGIRRTTTGPSVSPVAILAASRKSAIASPAPGVADSLWNTQLRRHGVWIARTFHAPPRHKFDGSDQERIYCAATRHIMRSLQGPTRFVENGAITCTVLTGHEQHKRLTEPNRFGLCVRSVGSSEPWSWIGLAHVSYHVCAFCRGLYVRHHRASENEGCEPGSPGVDVDREAVSNQAPSNRIDLARPEHIMECWQSCCSDETGLH